MSKINSSAENCKMQRVSYLDGLRSLSCLFVVILHAGAFVLQTLPLNPLNFWIGNIFDAASRFAVPVFVMVSGTLMLDEKYAYTPERLGRHIKNLTILFFSWSAFYCVIFRIVKPLLAHEPIQIADTVFMFLRGYSHLWFLPMIVGCYLMVPLLRLWVCRQNIKYVEYFLLLSFLFGFAFPQLLNLCALIRPEFAKYQVILENFYIFYPVGYLAYFVAGWYFDKKQISNRWLIAMIAAGYLITCLGTYFLSIPILEQGKMEKLLYQNLTVNVSMVAVGIFGLYRNNHTASSAMEKRICRYSLGIYVIHPIIVSIVGVKFLKRGVTQGPIVFIVCLTSAFLVSFICSSLGKKISFLKNIV